MRAYKCLQKQIFQSSGFSLVPLRDEDKYEIMRWRNEQIYHLRQAYPLTEEKQDLYFNNTVIKLFEEEKPEQVLFSYLENNICLGYGGLVHINWQDKNAEISFIIKTELEKDFFEFHWKKYLSLIEEVAFSELKLHKIFTYAYDLRPKLYKAVENAGYIPEARLTEHSLFEKRYIDVVIHSKINPMVTYREANAGDILLYFDWANDEEVRKNSFNQQEIEFGQHKKWFDNKLNDPDCVMLVATMNAKEAGQIRFEKGVNNAFVINFSVEKNFRGKGVGSNLLKEGSKEFFKIKPMITRVTGKVKKENFSSKKSFLNAGFTLAKDEEDDAIDIYFLDNK